MKIEKGGQGILSKVYNTVQKIPCKAFRTKVILHCVDAVYHPETDTEQRDEAAKGT